MTDIIEEVISQAEIWQFSGPDYADMNNASYDGDSHRRQETARLLQKPYERGVSVCVSADMLRY